MISTDVMIMLGLLVVLVVALVFFAYITVAGRTRNHLDKVYYQKAWQRVEQLQSQGNTGWQLAIFEADKLLDQALKASGHPGSTMGDRLKGARGVFKNTDNVWQAHKLRNRLAHETDVRLNNMVVSRALRQFKSALKDLGAL